MMTEVCGANNCIAMDSRNLIVVVIDMRMFYFMMRRKLLHRIEQCVWSYQSYDDGGMWWYQSGDDVCLPKCYASVARSLHLSWRAFFDINIPMVVHFAYGSTANF